MLSSAQAQVALKKPLLMPALDQSLDGFFSTSLVPKFKDESFNKSYKVSLAKATFVEGVFQVFNAWRVVRDLAKSGHPLIFIPSLGYLDAAMRVAREFPQVCFESVLATHKQLSSCKIWA